MVTITDQIDKFHEDICRWDLFEDVLNAPSQNVEPKHKFYAPEEYHYHQKQLL